MATYPVKHQDTGETKEVVMSIHDWDKWCEDNPDWQRYYTPDNAPLLGLEVGEWKDRLIKQKPEWNEILNKASKAPGSVVTKI